MKQKEKLFPIKKHFKNPYIDQLNTLYQKWSFNQETAPLYKSFWRQKVFKTDMDTQVHLEIGTGNGSHLSYISEKNPNEFFLGIEWKFKTATKSIRSFLSKSCLNARMIHYDASHIEDLFGKDELNNLFIYFPDPWPKRKHQKNRLIQEEFLKKLYFIQRKNSFIYLKTDSLNYFEHCLKVFEKTKYKINKIHKDLEPYEYSSSLFLTHFETIFKKQKLPIYYLSAKK